jgi:hypothetical protein
MIAEKRKMNPEPTQRRQAAKVFGADPSRPRAFALFPFGVFRVFRGYFDFTRMIVSELAGAS